MVCENYIKSKFQWPLIKFNWNMFIPFICILPMGAHSIMTELSSCNRGDRA